MKFIAALYCNGRVVTGLNHADAFAKLSLKERDECPLESGFYDSRTGHFLTDSNDFYLKQLFLIRHAEPVAVEDRSPLTAKGRTQAIETAQYLRGHDLSDYEGFVSPIERCLQTAQIISEIVGINFVVRADLRSRQEESESETQFSGRLSESLTEIPLRAVVVSHGDVVREMAFRAIGHHAPMSVAHASVTHIFNRKILTQRG